MPETISNFHFAAPHWLWALLIPPLVAAWLAKTVRRSENAKIKDYADSHLLPHLTGSLELLTRGKWRLFLFWALLWLLLVLAMAGPRWDYKDIQLFSPRNSLVILLDISRSMQVEDVQPSRFSRARQELADLLDLGHGVRMGLIAFASVAHVISPVTEDLTSIRRLLPALSTDLVRLQGSRLSLALDRAAELLENQPADGSHAILLISDGDFVEPGAEEKIRALAAKGIKFHALGIGTTEGDWVPAPERASVGRMSWRPVLSRLNESLLQSLAKAGNGTYQSAGFLVSDTQNILETVLQQSSMKLEEENLTRIWREYFFWLVGLVLLLLVPQFKGLKMLKFTRKGAATR